MERAWQDTREADTLFAYYDFRERFPGSPHDAEADARERAARIRDIAWQQTQAKGGTDAYEAFLRQFPDTPYTLDAERRIGRLDATRAWEFAEARDSVAGYRGFLADHPASQFDAEARAALQRLERADTQARYLLDRAREALDARPRSTLKARIYLETLVGEYGRSPAARNGFRMLRDLIESWRDPAEVRAQHERAAATAKAAERAGDPAGAARAWKRFLGDFPDAPGVTEAAREIRRLRRLALLDAEGREPLSGGRWSALTFPPAIAAIVRAPRAALRQAVARFDAAKTFPLLPAAALAPSAERAKAWRSAAELGRALLDYREQLGRCAVIARAAGESAALFGELTREVYFNDDRHFDREYYNGSFTPSERSVAVGFAQVLYTRALVYRSAAALGGTLRSPVSRKKRRAYIDEALATCAHAQTPEAATLARLIARERP